MTELPAPQQERSRLSTAKLLDAAADLITERGYERTTLALIGERAGYSHGLVTRRFGSKEGLLWALIERFAVEWTDQLMSAELSEVSGNDALHTLVNSLEASVRSAPDRMNALYSLMFEAIQPIPTLQERMRELHVADRKHVEKVIRRGIKEGSVDRGTDVGAVARLFIGALRGAAYQSLLDPGRIGLGKAFNEIHLLVDRLLPVVE